MKFGLKEQTGRSMVEMLGVLAIIGVLSVGGITGYSKAMAKFKLNRALDQLSILIINIRSAFTGSQSFTGLSNQTAISMTVVPSDMLPDGLGNSNGVIAHALAGTVNIGNTNGGLHFTIRFDGLSSEACTSLASSNFTDESLESMQINDATAHQQVDLPLSAIEAVAECNKPNQTNEILWEYY